MNSSRTAGDVGTLQLYLPDFVIIDTHGIKISACAQYFGFSTGDHAFGGIGFGTAASFLISIRKKSIGSLKLNNGTDTPGFNSTLHICARRGCC